MRSAEFDPAIPEIKQLHTYALHRTATGLGQQMSLQSTNEEG
jgi:hypothetical protein